jgi:PAS domain S-box-containing protein
MDMTMSRQEQSNSFWFLEKIEDIAFVLSKEGKILQFNKGAQNFYQLETSHLNSRIFDVLTSKEQDLPFQQAQLSRLVDSSERQTFLTQQPITIEWELGPLFLEEDSKKYLLTGKIVSEQDELKELFQLLPGFIYWTNEQGIYKGCNDNFLEAVGLHHSNQLIGKNFLFAGSRLSIQESSIIHFYDQDLEVIKNGQTIITMDDLPVNTPNKDGFHFLTTRVPLKNSQQEITGVLGICMDISDRIRIEESLRHAKEAADKSNQERFEMIAKLNERVIGKTATQYKTPEEHVHSIKHHLENIIANMPGNVYWMDKNYVYLGCNDNIVKMLGLQSRDEIIGMTYEDFARIGGWSEVQLESFRRDDMTVMQTGMPLLNIEEPPIHDRDGNDIYFLSSRVPWRDENGQITGVIGISMDITSRKLAELKEIKAQQEATMARSKAKTEEELRQAVMVLTGSIVHDLRTPIVTINMLGANLTKLLPLLIEAYESFNHENQQLKNRDLNFLRTAGQTLNRLAQNMNDFIDVTLKTLSKTLTGDLTKEDLVICSIDHCIAQTLASYPYLEGEEKLIHWERDYDFSFLGNPVLMIRILSNLIKNALYQIHFHHKGEINIRTYETEDANVLSVMDSASGVSREFIQSIFEGYQTTKKEGTGVGLAFCKKTMQDFGGDIICHSEENAYIEFILSFPKEIN